MFRQKETETIDFVRKDGILTATVPTKEVKTSFHYDVAILIALFALTMFSLSKSNDGDE